MSNIPVPEKPFKDEELNTDAVSKGNLLQFISEHGDPDFLKSRAMGGKLANLLKKHKKEKAIEVYLELYEKSAFRDPNKVVESAEADSKPNEATGPVVEEKPVKKEEVKEQVRYVKTQLKKGDKVHIPKVGDTVSCWYTGYLPDGTIFDSNCGSGTFKKFKQPISFKLGSNKVIKGWEEVIKTMSKGEKCKVVIEPEWAYGKKGNAAANIKPNTTLTFEIELVQIAY